MKKQLINKYFDKKLDISVRVFNLTMFIAIIAGILAAASGLLVEGLTPVVMLDASLAFLAFMLLRIAEKRKCYRLISLIFVILVFFILFPILFIFGGAYRNGMDYLFMIAFVIVIVLFEGKERIAIIAIQAAIYGICFIIAYFKPQAIIDMPKESNHLYFYLSNFALVCVIIMVIVLMHNQVFKNRQEQIEELNRELTSRNETLVQYDTMKSNFLADVAHELSNPLAVISASSNDTLDVLKEIPIDIDGITENEMDILHEVKLINSIIAHLMNTVAIETGRIPLDRKLVSLSELAIKLCNYRHEKLDVQNNKLTYDLQSELPWIWLDPNKIEQVLTNLLSNAFKHTKDGNIEIKLIRKDSWQILSVTDDGEGMDKEMAEVAFKQYVTTKSDNWQHGFGLPICYRIIKAHGGSIWIDSEKGCGTKISFSLSEDAEYD